MTAPTKEDLEKLLAEATPGAVVGLKAEGV
jgi:hypothetical protein